MDSQSENLIDLSDDKCGTGLSLESSLPSEEENLPPKDEIKEDNDNLKEESATAASSKSELKTEESQRLDDKNLPLASEVESVKSPKLVVKDDLQTESKIETSSEEGNLPPKDEIKEDNDNLKEESTTAASSKSELKTEESQRLEEKDLPLVSEVESDRPPKLVVEDDLQTESKIEMSSEGENVEIKEDKNDDLMEERATPLSPKSQLKTGESSKSDVKDEPKAEKPISERVLRLEDFLPDGPKDMKLLNVEQCVLRSRPGVNPTKTNLALIRPQVPMTEQSRSEYVEKLQNLLASKHEKFAALLEESKALKQTVETRDVDIAILEGEQVHLEATLATFKNSVHSLNSIMEKLEKLDHFDTKKTNN